MRYVQKLKLDTDAEHSSECRTAIFGSLSAIGTCRIDHVLLSPAASPVDLHSSSEERLVYVLTGAVSLKEGGDVARLEANDFLFVPRSRAIVLMGTDSRPGYSTSTYRSRVRPQPVTPWHYPR